jgi:hypothetical protein
MLRVVLVGLGLSMLMVSPAYGSVTPTTAAPSAENPRTEIHAQGHSSPDGRGQFSLALQDDFQDRKPGYKGTPKHVAVSYKFPHTNNPYLDMITNYPDCPSSVQRVDYTSDFSGAGADKFITCPDGTVTIIDMLPTDPNQPRTKAPVPPEVTQFAHDFFAIADIPQPQPVISAPEGICGVVHTLNLHMPTEAIYTYDDSTFGPMIMHVYGTVKVDWGDGTGVDTYTDGGADFPNSDIGHSYTTVGHYKITVTASWIARITIGPYQGQTYNLQVGGVTTSGQIPDFHVIQLQAVITNG